MILDLNVFPRELNMFEAEVAWRISPCIAVVEDVLQRTADRAGIILQLNDYSYTPLAGELLEDYFRDGDDAGLLVALEVEVPLLVASGES